MQHALALTLWQPASKTHDGKLSVDIEDLLGLAPARVFVAEALVTLIGNVQITRGLRVLRLQPSALRALEGSLAGNAPGKLLKARSRHKLQRRRLSNS
jgi:hypothetical protein